MTTSTKKLYCYSYNEFKEIVNDIPENVAVISIVSSPELCYIDECHLLNGNNVLNLDFDDASESDIGEFKLFDDDIANKAYEFIDKYVNAGYDFYIHCSAGKSRSQAFVRYILDIYYYIDWEIRKENPCQFPNYYVLSKLKKIAYEKNIEKNI